MEEMSGVSNPNFFSVKMLNKIIGVEGGGNEGLKENKTVSVGVRLTPVEKEMLECICAVNSANISTVIRKLILKEYE